MNLVDVILILMVGGFVFFGLFFGLIHTLFSLVGSIAGVVIASQLVGPVSDRFGFLFGGGGFGKVVVFILIYFIIARVLGLVFWLLKTMFGWFAWIPLAGVFDRLLGAAFGLVEGLLFVGVALFVALQFLPDDAVRAALSASIIGKYLLALVAAFQVLFPQSLRLKS
jgi:membrane protein required for colicin V production